MHTTPFLYAIYCVCIGKFDNISIPLPFVLALPFTTETVLGWFTAWALAFNMALVYGTTMVSITSYFVSCCTYICAMCDHFNLLMKWSNENALRFNDEKCPIEKRKLKKKIKENLS